MCKLKNKSYLQFLKFYLVIQTENSLHPFLFSTIFQIFQVNFIYFGHKHMEIINK